MKMRALCMLGLASFVACGGNTAENKPVDAPTDNSNDHPRTNKNAPSVSQELGEIDLKDAERAIQKVQPQILGCQKQAASHLEYLSGDFRVFARIDADGHVRWSYFEESSIGDRATEKCILDALAHAPWPKPRGGEAEVRKGLAFDAGDAREPTAWASDKMFDAIASAQKSIDKCKAGTSGNFAVTAYVVPDGKNGKVEAAGIAPPNKEGEAKVDCLVDVVKSMRVPSPGSYAAKVSFKL